MFMSAADYRESLRRLSPRVFVNGRRVASVADDPDLAPGVAAIGLTYDACLDRDLAQHMVATDAASGQPVNRMLHIVRSADDLLRKLEAVRILCQGTGCAQRYLMGDAFNALLQATYRTDAETGSDYQPRFLAYLRRAREQDIACAIAMTDAKGDRSLRPHAQVNPDTYVHVVERRRDGVVISGTKAIVTSAPYVHELLVMPCRTMTEADREFAVCCAVPADAEGVTIVSRPAGRPGQPAANFSGRYGQAVAAVIFDRVFVPWERVFLDGEWQHAGFLTTAYATHHRHSCIAARAGFGDLLIGAGVLMCDANGLEPGRHHHLRDALVELIKIVEGFYACGVAASVHGVPDPAGNVMPEPVYANIGKLLLATQIYDMHRLAHEVSGGLLVALPGPEEDHNPETAGSLQAVLAGRADIPASHRMSLARLMEDLTASDNAGWYSLISLHGGGSPEAMKMEIYRNYPLRERAALVEQLLERGMAAGSRAPALNRQPDRCCAEGCQTPESLTPPAVAVSLPRRKEANS